MASIAFDSSENQTSASPNNFAHVCSGTNRLLVVSVTQNKATDDITGVTYNGVSLTKLNVEINVGGIGTQSLWYLLNPASGSHTVSVTSSNADQIFVAAASYVNVLALDNNTSSSTGASATTYAQSITSVADNCWAIAIADASASVLSAGTNTFLRQANGYGGDISDTNADQTPPGVVTMNWNTGNGSHSVCIATFSPVPSGPPLNVDVTNSFVQGVKIVG